MFLRNDHGLELSGNAAALSFGRLAAPAPTPGLIDRLHERYPDFELVPDLGSRIGTREWWRGAATCLALCTTTLLLSPGFTQPIYGHVAPALAGDEWAEARAQSIAPIALGATSGRRMAATDAVQPLKDTPERPTLEMSVSLGRSDGFEGALRRAGVSRDEAATAAELIGQAVSPGDLKAGTRADLTLGRRLDRNDPRPLEKIAFRARFDLAVEVIRAAGALSLRQIPIAVDHTPLRIRGRIGSSLYRSARAAGVPAKSVEAFIKSLATRTSIARLGADGEFDIIVERARAETGEVRLGTLQYAGLTQGGTRIQLVAWEQGGRTEWFDTGGKGERKGMMSAPVPGPITSAFGFRRHPILGYRRMHAGLDFRASYGTPIRAATDGVVAMAGRNGGYGNFVKLNHGGCYATGYGHMSRIAVRAGSRVSRGQVIGYVGSTGLSTGPHLHYELWCSGRPVNPRSVSFSSTQQLGGKELAQFRAKVQQLLATPVGGAGDEATVAATMVAR